MAPGKLKVKSRRVVTVTAEGPEAAKHKGTVHLLSALDTRTVPSHLPILYFYPPPSNPGAGQGCTRDHSNAAPTSHPQTSERPAESPAACAAPFPVRSLSVSRLVFPLLSFLSFPPSLADGSTIKGSRQLRRRSLHFFLGRHRHRPCCRASNAVLLVSERRPGGTVREPRYDPDRPATDCTVSEQKEQNPAVGSGFCPVGFPLDRFPEMKSRDHRARDGRPLRCQARHHRGFCKGTNATRASIPAPPPPPQPLHACLPSRLLLSASTPI